MARPARLSPSAALASSWAVTTTRCRVRAICEGLTVAIRSVRNAGQRTLRHGMFKALAAATALQATRTTGSVCSRSTWERPCASCAPWRPRWLTRQAGPVGGQWACVRGVVPQQRPAPISLDQLAPRPPNPTCLASGLWCHHLHQRRRGGALWTQARRLLCLQVRSARLLQERVRGERFAAGAGCKNRPVGLQQDWPAFTSTALPARPGPA